MRERQRVGLGDACGLRGLRHGPSALRSSVAASSWDGVGWSRRRSLAHEHRGARGNIRGSVLQGSLSFWGARWCAGIAPLLALRKAAGRNAGPDSGGLWFGDREVPRPAHFLRERGGVTWPPQPGRCPPRAARGGEREGGPLANDPTRPQARPPCQPPPPHLTCVEVGSYVWFLQPQVVGFFPWSFFCRAQLGTQVSRIQSFCSSLEGKL